MSRPIYVILPAAPGHSLIAVLPVHTYNRLPLKVAVKAGFMGWLACVLVAILEEKSPPSCIGGRELPVEGLGGGGGGGGGGGTAALRWYWFK